MASYNRVILMGNLTRDIQLRYTPAGTPVTEVGLAVNDRRKGANGEWIDETTFVEVTFPLELQSIRPCPLIVPLTSAMTPSVSRVISSGCKLGPKVRPGTSSKAWPAPLERRCSMFTLVTRVPLDG